MWIIYIMTFFYMWIFLVLILTNICVFSLSTLSTILPPLFVDYLYFYPLYPPVLSTLSTKLFTLIHALSTIYSQLNTFSSQLISLHLLPLMYFVNNFILFCLRKIKCFSSHIPNKYFLIFLNTYINSH